MARTSSATTRARAAARSTKPAGRPRRGARRSGGGGRPGASALPRVRVRMYRQGLGDCFLVTFDAGGSERHMLIDCGTLGAVTTGVRMTDVVADIRRTCSGRLHLLVATHEHKDHVCGFREQRHVFEQIAVDQVWLAWTENPADELARELARHREEVGLAAARSAAALQRRRSVLAREVGLAIESVLGFFDDPDRLGTGAFSPTVDEAMTVVRSRATPRYLEPGEGPIEVPVVEGFRFYVLGPPRDRAALFETGEHRSADLYGIATALGCPADFFASGKTAREYVVDSDTESRAAFETGLPFDARFRVECRGEAARRMFGDSYLAEAEAWRTVDDDWLRVASDLALQLDLATNNTSLALAIERVADGRVLLFPGDAQQGSWTSWHADTMRWTVGGGDATARVSAADLLARTVFYKVGHHASHNATAKGHGLELMKAEDELIAFIPVDRAAALKRHPRGAWRMPAPALLRRLLERCQGRVVRSDLGWVTSASTADKTVEKDLAGIARPQEWSAWRKAQQAATRVQVHDLYVDYVLD